MFRTDTGVIGAFLLAGILFVLPSPSLGEDPIMSADQIAYELAPTRGIKITAVNLRTVTFEFNSFQLTTRRGSRSRRPSHAAVSNNCNIADAQLLARSRFANVSCTRPKSPSATMRCRRFAARCGRCSNGRLWRRVSCVKRYRLPSRLGKNSSGRAIVWRT